MTLLLFTVHPDSGAFHPDEFWKQLLTYIDALPRFLQHFDGQPDGNIVFDSTMVSYHQSSF